MAKEMNERKRREFKLRRDYIIDISEKLFYNKGYENVTLNEIADACEYTKATIYTYLKSKDELYLEVYCRGFEQRTNYLNEHIKHSVNGFEEIKSFGEAYYNFYAEFPAILYHQQYMDFRPLDPAKMPEELMEKFMEINTRSSNIVLDALNKGVQDGSIKGDLNVDFFIGQLVMSLRACASAAVYGRKTVLTLPVSKETNEKWYKMFLNLLLSAIKS